MNEFKSVTPSASLHTDNSFDIPDFSSFAEEPLHNDVTETPGFSHGLTSETHRTGEFRDQTSKGLREAFNYIARHVNPHQFNGMLSNVLSIFSGGALNQNCVTCSKAVEKNLAAMESKQIDNFWVAESTVKSGLAQNVSPEHYTTFPLEPKQPLSKQLLQHSQEESRSIIIVPVKGKGFSHAMNLVRTSAGAIVIDGQFGVLYNLNLAKDKQNFDKHYGPGNGTNVVQVYQTGLAPRPADIDLGDWELVEVEATQQQQQPDPTQNINEYLKVYETKK